MNFVTLNQAQINWLLAQGVSPWAITRPAPIMCCHGERAADGRLDENPDGPRWLVFEESDDLVFWQPRTGEIATDEGHAFALGEEAIDNPATTALDQWLRIFATPLEWLQNDRAGIVVVHWEFAFDRLRDVTRIAVSEPMLATYKRSMKPRRMPKLAVLPMAERIAA